MPDTPNKLEDSRHEMYRGAPTFHEVLESAKGLQQKAAGYDELKADTSRLDGLLDLIKGRQIYIPNARNFYQLPFSDPEEDKSDVYGRFLGLDCVRFVGKSAEMYENPSQLCVVVNSGQGMSRLGLARFTYEVDRYVPVGGIKYISSLDELNQLMKPSASDDGQRVFEHLEKIIEYARAKGPNGIDLKNLPLLERWDFRESSGVSIQDLRRMLIKVKAERAKIFFSDTGGQPFWIDQEDISIAGYYWGLSGLERRLQKSRKPSFVFEVYGTDDEGLNGLFSSLDLRTNQPIAYIPISSQVQLEVSLPE